MTIPRIEWSRVVVEGLAAYFFAFGCLAQTPANADGVPNQLDAALAQAAERKTPLILLVAELARSHADNAAVSLLESSTIQRRTASLTVFILDLSLSRNRAIAARFHPLETPLLLCLTPNGIIMNRDEERLSKKLVLRRIDEAVEKASRLDAEFAALQNRVKTNADPVAAQLELANFLMDHGNAKEAIPCYDKIADDEAGPDALRVQAWVGRARAHLWIGEPEKAREEARELDSSLGARCPEARAGAELVLGIHDANLRRPNQARAEFEEAMAVAPESLYAKQAGLMLVELKKGWKLK